MKEIRIPDDLIFDILSRLPARSVGKLRCVSKRWRSIATDPMFIKIHASLAPVSGLFIETGNLRHRHFPVEVNGDLINISDPTLSGLNIGSFKATFRCACNGLILCTYRPAICFICICNPIAKQRAFISLPQGPRLKRFTLAFDPSRSPHHFKVVGFEQNFETRTFKIHVYSSESRLWNPLNESIEMLCWGYNNSVFWNGSLVWAFSRDMLLLPWDADQGEPARRLPLPRRGGKWPTYFGESRGRLHFIARSIGDDDDHAGFDVLEMESESAGWSLLYHIDLNKVCKAMDNK